MLRRLAYVLLVAAALIGLVSATGALIGVSVPARAGADRPARVDVPVHLADPAAPDNITVAAIPR